MDGMILPDAEWRRRRGLDRLVAAIDGARFVGGSVRDTLLGIPVADIDIATPLPPETVLVRLKESAIKSVPTGLKHGTITAVLADGPVEVTTLRRDVDTDGRHAVVAFTDDWREDAARRDFTINALYADPASGRVFDYFGGLADLEAGLVRFIGDPYARIAEDHLRILRFFRFLARFGNEPDAAGLDACTARAKDLMALSRERIADELLKLLVAKDAVKVVALMIERGIFAPVLPEIVSADRLAMLAEREAATGTPPNAIRRLASLLTGDIDSVGARLKFSNAQRQRLTRIATHAGDENPRALGFRIGTEQATDVLLLSDRALGEVTELQGWEPPALPIGGGAIVARGVKAGPDVARLLGEVCEQWIAEGFPDAARVGEITDAAVARALGAK